MKYTIASVFLFSLLLFAQCKKNPGNNDPDPTGSPKVLEVTNILLATESKFIEIGQQTNAHPQDVLALTADWLKTKPGVKEVFLVDSMYIYITTSNDMITMFALNMVDAQGNSIFRGGGKGGAVLKSTGGKARYQIENKKVLIFSPVPQFFNDRTPFQLATSSIDFDVTIMKGPECKPHIIETFGQYGLVIINTHGDLGGFLSGCSVHLDTLSDTTEAIVKNKVEAQAGAGIYEKLLNDKLRLGSYMLTTEHPAWQSMARKGEANVLITSTYIESLPAMPGTIIFGNMCHSGQTVETYSVKKPIANAFTSRGLITYYNYAVSGGHSAVVNDTFAKQCEDSLIYSLITEIDSTGNAHLKVDGGMFEDTLIKGKKNSRIGNQFRQTGKPDYSYDDCIDTFIDGRDLKVYKAVCIGDQIWMAENLRYVSADAFCYNSDPNMCETYGRHYMWNAAMAGAASSNANPSGVKGVCPSKWHLPSKAEWEELINTLGGESAAGGAAKALTLWLPPNSGTTGSSGFNALPAGDVRYSASGILQYTGLGSSTYFLSTTIENSFYYAVPSLGNIGPDMTMFTVVTNKQAAPIRCVKD